MGDVRTLHVGSDDEGNRVALEAWLTGVKFND